ncbi:hypothetical protein [Kitasatospora sp. NBC_00315]|uniref:hypothetical protein n=1 Tax=Kitasatospora sp. NBC_00315 TaxID=2975963 RepID=UPI00324AA99D
MGALWSLLLVGLLTVLPCAASAQAAAGEAGALLAPATGPVGPRATAPGAGTADATPTGTAAPRDAAPTGRAAALAATVASGAPHHGQPAVRYADERPDHTWCSALDGLPRNNNGCSSHPSCAQESQLPNAPPQPVPGTLPRLVTVDALPETPRPGTPVAHRLAPDLHELQIHRS